MRPQRIELEGFGAFRELTVVDFDDLELFALVGPTGSGKSTLIDALCFALYGVVPRYDDHRLVGPVVSLGANQARVRVTFELGGSQYVVARVVRLAADGRATTREARLERLDGDRWTTLAGTATELDSKVPLLLGLGFTDFTRCVVLPQGDFARFLHDKPQARRDLLVRLMNAEVYREVAQRAKAREAEAEAARSAATAQLGRLPQHDHDALVAATALDASALAALQAVLDAQPQLAEIEVGIAQGRHALDVATAMVAALAAARMPPTAVALGEHVERAAMAMAAAVEEGERREAAAAASEAAHAALGPAAPLHDLVAARGRLTAVQVEAGTAAAEAAEAVSAERAAVEALAGAEAIEAAAAQSEAATHLHHRAAVLARDLVVGQPCPVCEQVVSVLPAPPADDPVEVVDSRLREAREAVVIVRRAVTAAAERRATTEATASRLINERVGLVSRLAGAPTIDEAQRELGRHDEVLATARAARAAATAARGTVSAAEAAHRAATARLGAASASFHAQRDSLVSLSPPAPTPDLVTSWRRLGEWAGARAGVAEQGRLDAVHHLEACRAQGEAVVAGVRSLCEAAGGAVPTRATIGDLQRLAVERRLVTGEAVAAIERARSDATSLLATERDAADRRDVAKLLAQQLSGRNFENWLVGGALADLVALASLSLRDLSSGRFGLAATEGGDVQVIDHANADERRSVKTLSGGETFQASLALALALSDRLAGAAAGGTARLDALFLDEGFGTLDAESLDTVASTIEAIGTSGRMVGIVTHVRELAERVPVRFEVTRGVHSATVRRVTP